MAEVKDVVVPDIGDFSDVPVIEVMVSPGDTVAEEDPLVTLESDKATMDVPSPFGGVVQELKVKTGDTVSEGSPLLTLDVSGSDGAAAESGNGASASGGVTTPAAEAGAADTVETAIQAEESAEAADEPSPPVREPEAPSDGDREAASEPEAEPAAGGPVYAGPGARRLARELGVDLRQGKGTGRKGRIRKEDVEAAGKRGGAPAAPEKPAATDGAGLGLLPWPQVDFEKFGEV